MNPEKSCNDHVDALDHILRRISEKGVAVDSAALQQILLEHQAGDGHWPFPPENQSIESEAGVGPAYSTALAVLMLSLEKQYLPMYQRQMRS